MVKKNRKFPIMIDFAGGNLQLIRLEEDTPISSFDCGDTEKTYTVDEAFDIVGRRLSRNYGVEIKID
ncbi:hypothetical protein FACS1894123_05560 [Bacteroidia bacterium]|nr:hypothetical protein FACS1894123_05560 [Bacteroidia bacterium]